MIKRICDKCNKEIQGNYWTIDIYQQEDDVKMVTTKGAENNFKQNMDKMFNRQKQYCENCIEEIKKIIEGVKNV